MNKRITFLAMMLVISTCAFPQTWPKVYSSGANSQDADETYDNGFAILSNLSVPIYSTYAGWLIKTDINGEILWTRILGRKEDYSSYVNSLETTSDSGFVISLNTGFLENNPFGGTKDAAFLKLNACGQLDWCKIFNLPDIRNYCEFITQTSDGYIGTYTIGVNNNYLVKFNLVGEIQWLLEYNLPILDDKGFYDIIELRDSTILISGYAYYTQSGSGGNIKPLKLNIDKNGNIINFQILYFENDTLDGAVDNQTIVSSDGRLFSTGTTYLSRQSLRKHSLTEQNPVNYLIGNTMEDSYSLCWMQDSTIAIAGIYNNQVIDEGYFDISIVDTLGLIHNRRQLYSNTNNACYLKLTNTFGNKIIATGPVAFTISNFNMNTYLYKFTSSLEDDVFDPTPREYDYACSGGVALNDTIGMEECDIVVSAENLASLPDVVVMEVYPNPVRDHFQVRLPEFIALRNNNRGLNTALYQSNYQQQSVLQVFDLTGRLIKEQKLALDQLVAEFDASDWVPGMYLLRLVYKDKTVGSSKVVK